MSELSQNPEYVSQVRRLLKRTTRRPWWLAYAALLVAVAGGVVALTLLGTQTAPTVSVPAPAVALNCMPPTNLLLWNETGVQGHLTTATFTCSGTTAMTGNGASAKVSSFSAGGWDAGVFVYANGTQPAAGCAGATLITLGSAFAFSLGTGYNYCAAATAPGAAVTGFSVSWSQ